MAVVWKQPRVAVAEVAEKVSRQQGWHSRTIRTLLGRLTYKGALKITRDCKRYLYDPLISQEECVRGETEDFVKRVFAGEQVAMLKQLVKETKLSREETRELKKMLSEKRNERFRLLEVIGAHFVAVLRSDCYACYELQH